MCGIAGIIGSYPNAKSLLIQMLKRISHRGEESYQNESVISSNYAIGTNRLAIVDETSGKQPFSWNKKVFCVLNGEIYNHSSLREKISTSYNFTSNCDTEIVLASYLHFGIDFVRFLDGKYSICIVDTRVDSYLLARDHIGIKPLYYAKQNGVIYFSSELKSFCDIPSIMTINSLLPGEMLIKDKLIKHYTVPNFTPSYPTTSLLNEVGLRLTRAIEKRIPYDSKKIACLLSGGIDSSAILYIANKLHSQVEAFTFANAFHRSEDLIAAKKLCNELGINHFIVSPDEEELRNFYLEQGVYLTESYEPVLVRNAVSYHYLCKAVKMQGYKYLLNGEGADELFGGYDYFKEVSENLKDETIRESLLNLHLSYLQMADRASMYATIEARVPYMDKDFINFCCTLPSNFRINGKVDKWALREFFKNKLPEYIVFRKKVGMNEGSGHGINKPSQGIYANAVKAYYRDDDMLLKNDLEKCQDYASRYQINTSDLEEVYNFSRFVYFGYHRLLHSDKRLQLNTALLSK